MKVQISIEHSGAIEVAVNPHASAMQTSNSNHSCLLILNRRAVAELYHTLGAALALMDVHPVKPR